MVGLTGGGGGSTPTTLVTTSSPRSSAPPTTPTKNVIEDVATLEGKLYFRFTESNQHKMGVVDLDFPSNPGHPPTAEFHEFDVCAEFDLLPEGICAACIHLVESMDELLAI
ncbi:hypothetical protein Zm00014a_042636 [Zea mays]|uniref:Uncharacterized protein n=1 Tax=Zea mays TaxID=4577 RepID=A0A3L6F989_MAIZE|nr:hypothetical protein Zm00014a_042636 [Zea mays]